MVIVSLLYSIACKPPGGATITCKGGEKMVLYLYHYEKEPVHVENVIKVWIDDNRTVLAKIKHRSEIRQLSFRYQTDYQRLTVNID